MLYRQRRRTNILFKGIYFALLMSLIGIFYIGCGASPYEYKFTDDNNYIDLIYGTWEEYFTTDNGLSAVERTLIKRGEDFTRADYVSGETRTYRIDTLYIEQIRGIYDPSTGEQSTNVPYRYVHYVAIFTEQYDTLFMQWYTADKYFHRADVCVNINWLVEPATDSLIVHLLGDRVQVSEHGVLKWVRSDKIITRYHRIPNLTWEW